MAEYCGKARSAGWIPFLVFSWILSNGPGLAAQAEDPRFGEVPLEAEGGWKASLVLDNGKTGIWTVRSFPIFTQYAAPEVVGLDDEGVAHVLVSYSGKWFPRRVIHDGRWLGGIAFGDIDPRILGGELYLGGQKGHLFQVLPHDDGGLSGRRIASFPGREIHTIVAGDLDAGSPGREVLVFTRPGALYLVTPTGKDGTFVSRKLAELPGRYRDAAVLPASGGGSPRIAAVSRSGTLDLFTVFRGKVERKTVFRSAMGMGRLALRRGSLPPVLYATLDDGRILRFEEGEGGRWKKETIYLGPQGMRGCVAGRFDADPEVETVAVFGYSKKVQLLSRKKGGRWKAETIFVDRDKGHWLEVAELDGRNGTEEILGSGYGGRIFLLSRPPGYGLSGIPVDPDPEKGKKSKEERKKEGSKAGVLVELDRKRFPRVAVFAGKDGFARLSPLRYRGGFLAKTLICETLVRRDDRGRLVPGLASSWEWKEGGRRFLFTIRKGARFHDGSPVRASDLVLHFRRWVGLPEHGWLRVASRIRSVKALSEDRLEIRLSSPGALIPELCAINPCAVLAPRSFDREGEFRKPIGSGPYVFDSLDPEAAGMILRLRDDPAQGLHLIRYGRDVDRDPLRDFEDGSLDFLADCWSYRIPRTKIPAFRADPEVEVLETRGSSLVYLGFSLVGPTASVGLRRAVAAALDRKALIDAAEDGRAEVAESWSPSFPRSGRSASEGAEFRPERPREPLRLDPGEGAADLVLAKAIAEGLRTRGIPCRILEGGSSRKAEDWDLRIEHSWGYPYDPFLSLAARFLPPTRKPSAAGRKEERVVLREMRRLVEEAVNAGSPEDLLRAYGRIREFLDRSRCVLPLYVPHRLALRRKGRRSPGLSSDLYRFRR